MRWRLDRHNSSSRARESNGLNVRLLRDRSTDTVTVAVEDLRSADRFQLPVARERALDAFYHPFAYAA